MVNKLILTQVFERVVWPNKVWELNEVLAVLDDRFDGELQQSVWDDGLVSHSLQASDELGLFVGTVKVENAHFVVNKFNKIHAHMYVHNQQKTNLMLIKSACIILRTLCM